MSKILSDRANKVIPGGVNSPVRAWKAVGGVPTHIDRGKGCRLFTNDDEELVDFCGSWGPLILGHAHPEVLEAVRKTASKGLSFGATTELEIEIAELLCRQIPYFEKNSTGELWYRSCDDGDSSSKGVHPKRQNIEI